jgi:hypothetical protein
MVLNREAEAFLFVQYKQNVLWDWRNTYILAQGEVKSKIITAVKNLTEILGNLKFQLQLARV